MKRDLSNELHDVYWLYDSEGRVLYVGCTVALEQRLNNHRLEKEWWPRVARVEVESYANRAEAMGAEHAAIVGETPIFNKVIPSPGPPMPPIIRRGEPIHAVEVTA